MWKVATGLAFALAVVASAWAGQNYVDPKYGFSVTFPDGWLVTADGVQGGGVSASLATPESVCVVAIAESEETKSSAQADLDLEMRQPFGLEFWRAQSPGGRDPVVREMGVREHPSGRPVQEAVIVEPASQGVASRTYRISIMATPGLVHVFLCATASDSYAQIMPSMREMLDSYRPAPPGPVSVSLAPPPPVSAVKAAAATAAKSAHAAASNLRRH